MTTCTSTRGRRWAPPSASASCSASWSAAAKRRPMPGQEAGAPAGRTGHLRDLLGAAVGLLGTHVELFGLELQEEKERLRELLLLGILAGAGLTLGLLLASAFLVMLFWDSYRLQVLG